MKDDVAVGMAVRTAVGGDLDPAEDAAAPRHERVRVEALPDPEAPGRTAASHASARARSTG